MKSLNKFLAVYLLIGLMRSAFAGNALTFDKPDLVAFVDNEKVSGFYSAIDGARSCVFLFSNAGMDDQVPSERLFSVTKVLTFVPGENSQAFESRYKEFDITGLLYRRGDEWVIRTSRPQAGCGNALGVFEFGPNDLHSVSYFVKSRIPAKGIMMVNAKTYFFNFKNGKYVRREGYLNQGDGVVVLKVRGQFSYVRYSDSRPDTDGRVTTGWVHSADLINPFPPGVNQ